MFFTFITVKNVRILFGASDGKTLGMKIISNRLGSPIVQHTVLTRMYIELTLSFRFIEVMVQFLLAFCSLK